MIGGEIVLTQKCEGEPIPADAAVAAGTFGDQVRMPRSDAEQAKGISGLGADAEGKGVPVILAGPAVGTAASGITAGKFVRLDGQDGRLREVGSEQEGATVYVVGIALTSAAAAGDKFDLLVAPSMYVV